MIYAAFFKRATESDPYPYQSKLAERRDLPILLKVPTGAGKTEAAVLGWLYRRFEHPDAAVRDSTPRRLLYCLPMRTLVDQIVRRVEEWLENLHMTDDVGVVTLMGGEPRKQWYLDPEKPFIVVGTQDMLLSRALNRGYGMGYNMWPVEYGLLNNDCHWVVDEIQLMANGLPTSTQLHGLRGKLKTFGPAQSVWMSATAYPDWLGTIDHPRPSAFQVMGLGSEDLMDTRLGKRRNAHKVLTEALGDLKNSKAMAAFVVDKHEPGTLTLVIVNTVERAQKIYRDLSNSRNNLLPNAGKLLLHSRFREADRKKKNESIAKKPDPSGAGMIVVATQAVEAGVDISARTLITELAPWASLVQRFGRCNRAGEDQQGDVFWVDVGDRTPDTAPYEPHAVQHARETIRSLEGKSVGPAALEELADAVGDVDHFTVIRRRDVVGLFDTTPDISGSYVDVSQYVRGMDETGVSVFWREQPTEDAPKPRHNETVNVPIGGKRGNSKGIRDHLEGGRTAWRWDFLDSRWRRIQPHDIHPGMTLMLDANQGGYTSEMGWDASSKEPVTALEGYEEPEDGQGSEPTNTRQRDWVALPVHSRNVEAEAKAILGALTGHISDSGISEAVALAALYHDAGKAHSAFQEMMRQKLRDGEEPPKEGEIVAKSPGNGRFGSDRRHFRHEVASALAVLKHADLSDGATRDLAAYLAAAHHGKLRLGIRSLPGARQSNHRDSNPDPDRLLGYRVSEPEILPCVDLGEGLHVPETMLDLSIAQIGLGDGGRSWLDRSLALLECLGPFRLAYLEAIVRAADMRASAKEQGVASK